VCKFCWPLFEVQLHSPNIWFSLDVSSLTANTFKLDAYWQKKPLELQCEKNLNMCLLFCRYKLFTLEFLFRNHMHMNFIRIEIHFMSQMLLIKSPDIYIVFTGTVLMFNCSSGASSAAALSLLFYNGLCYYVRLDLMKLTRAHVRICN